MILFNLRGYVLLKENVIFKYLNKLILCQALVNVDVRFMLLDIHPEMMNMISKKHLKNMVKLKKFHGKGGFVLWF